MSKTIRALSCIVVGLVLVAFIFLEVGRRPHLPGRPFALDSLWLAVGMVALGAFLMPVGRRLDRTSSAAVFRLKATALLSFGLTPFFVWHFPHYQNVYFVACGFAAAISFQLFLISLTQVLEARFAMLGISALARLCHLTGIAITPLMCAFTAIVYLHVFRVGADGPGIPVESAYSIWLRVSPALKMLSILPFLLTLCLTVVLFLDPKKTPAKQAQTNGKKANETTSLKQTE